MPPAKHSLPTPTPADQPAAEAATTGTPRWRWAKHADGSQVAERIEPRRDHQQAMVDLYGERPMLSTGAHMRQVSSILAELVSTLQLEEAEVAPELLAQAWQSAAGEFLATQAQLVGLANGQAIISTLHPAVRFELQRHKQHIIRALNATLGEGCVRSVRLIHG